jgi:Xaa-Pro aminopeptidase
MTGAPAAVPAARYAERRARVLAGLGERAALIIAAAPELRVGSDGELRYLPDADLYYLTGYDEPDAVLVLCPSAAAPFTLFVRPRDVERERWSGPRGGEDAARERFGADAAQPIAQLDTLLPQLVAGADTLYARLESGRAAVDAAVRGAFAAARHARPRTGRGPHTLVDPRLLLAPLRLRKDADELRLLREAARITVAAFTAGARQVTSATGEWQVEAALEHAMRRAGALGPAFPTIAAAGAHATVLHYTANDGVLPPDSLLLVDAGARYRMYCADVSRVYPTAGRFTAAQRAVYDVVLAAHAAAAAVVAPDCTAADVQHAAARALAAGMIELGLVRGTVDEVIERGDDRRYFPHRASHWLGLDVHDAGDYVDADGAATRLEPGMVLTIEPGLYVPADDDTAPAALRGIGVRLEDDFVVTDSGHDVLTSALPILPDEVEALLTG